MREFSGQGRAALFSDPAGRAARVRGGLLLAALLAFSMAAQAPTAWAGMKQVQMQVGIRIVASNTLAAASQPARGLAPVASRTSSASAPSATTAATTTTSSSPTILPRAGGGFCVRQPLRAGGFRWRCE